MADDWQPPRLTRRSSRWRSLEAMARGIGRPGWRRRHRAAAAISEIMDVLAGLLDRVKGGTAGLSPDNEKAIQWPDWLALTPFPSLGEDPGRKWPWSPQALLAGGRLQG